MVIRQRSPSSGIGYCCHVSAALTYKLVALALVSDIVVTSAATIAATTAATTSANLFQAAPSSNIGSAPTTPRYIGSARVRPQVRPLQAANSAGISVPPYSSVTSSNSTSEPAEAGIVTGAWNYSPILCVLIGSVLATVVLVTVLGNCLVCVTVLTDRRMHSPTNMFILSLASTDLCLGVLVLPFSVHTTLRSRWPFGATFCNLYVSLDVTLCTVSILALFAISLDRYCALSWPLRYQTKMNARIVHQSIAAIWVFSAILGFLPIHLGWNTNDLRIQNYSRPEICGFGKNAYYAMFVSLGTYFGPLFVMCAVYLSILRITRKQVKQINKLTAIGDIGDKVIRNGNGVSGDHSSSGASHAPPAPSKRKQHDARSGRRHSIPSHAKTHSVSDRKAIFTLASIVLAFAVCWVPYFVIFTLQPLNVVRVSPHFELTVLWLGYFNSAINPFLYAFYNTQFRNAFIRILCRNSPERKQRLLRYFRQRKKRKERRRYGAGGRCGAGGGVSGGISCTVGGVSANTSELSVLRPQVKVSLLTTSQSDVKSYC